MEFLDKIKDTSSQSFSNRIILGNEILIEINLKKDGNNINDNKNIININSEYIYVSESYKIQKEDKNILIGGDYKGFKSLLKEIIDYISNKANINNNSTRNSSNFKIIIKKIEKQKEIIEKVIELDVGSLLSDGKKFNFEIDLSKIEKYDFKNDHHLFTDKNRVTINEKNHIKYTSLSKNNNVNQNIEAKYPCRNIFKLKDGNYIMSYENKIYYGSNIFSHIPLNRKYFLFSKDAYIGGIKMMIL